MGTRMRDLLGSAHESLRYEPTVKRLRVYLADELVADTGNGLLNHEPLREAEPVRDHIAFFDERVDVIVDGQHRERPVTPWSG